MGGNILLGCLVEISAGHSTGREVNRCQIFATWVISNRTCVAQGVAMETTEVNEWFQRLLFSTHRNLPFLKTWSHTSYSTTLFKSKTNPHHLWQCWPDWLMILPSFHHFPCDGMARIQKWSWMKWRWILSWFNVFFFPTTRSFATKHQHGMAIDKKWCEMTWIFQLCLRFDNHHTASFWQSTANCDVSGKALSKTLSGTRPKTQQ